MINVDNCHKSASISTESAIIQSILHTDATEHPSSQIELALFIIRTSEFTNRTCTVHHRSVGIATRTRPTTIIGTPRRDEANSPRGQTSVHLELTNQTQPVIDHRCFSVWQIELNPRSVTSSDSQIEPAHRPITGIRSRASQSYSAHQSGYKYSSSRCRIESGPSVQVLVLVLALSTRTRSICPDTIFFSQHRQPVMYMLFLSFTDTNPGHD
jgi:hypothetical protein